MRIIGDIHGIALCSANLHQKPTTSTTTQRKQMPRQHQIPFNVAWADHRHKQERRHHELRQRRLHRDEKLHPKGRANQDFHRESPTGSPPNQST